MEQPRGARDPPHPEEQDQAVSGPLSTSRNRPHRIPHLTPGTSQAGTQSVRVGRSSLTPQAAGDRSLADDGQMLFVNPIMEHASDTDPGFAPSQELNPVNSEQEEEVQGALRERGRMHLETSSTAEDGENDEDEPTAGSSSQ